MEALDLKEGSEMQVRTHFPEYRFTLKWMIENFSKIPFDTMERSPEFRVDPESKWYGEFKRSKEHLDLFLIRNAKTDSVVNYTVSITDCDNKTLYKYQGAYNCPSTGTYHDMLLLISENMREINSAPKDKLLITVFIKVLLLPHETVDMDDTSLTSDLQQKQLETLSRDFKNLLDNTNDADVTLRVRGESMTAHKFILCARSSVFASMFQHVMAENEDNVVLIEDISMPTMKALVAFMYSGLLVDYDFDTALEVYYVADKYSVMDLRDICGRILVSKLTLDIASKVLSLADMHRDLVLKNRVMQYIAYHYRQE